MVSHAKTMTRKNRFVVETRMPPMAAKGAKVPILGNVAYAACVRLRPSLPMN